MIETATRSSSRRRRDSDAVLRLVERLFSMVFLAMVVLVTWRVVVMDVPAFGGLASRAYEAAALKHLIATGLDTNPDFRLVRFPPTGGLTVLILAVLSSFMEMALAAKAFMAGVLLLFSWTVYRLGVTASHTGGAYRAVIAFAAFAAGRWFWGGSPDVLLGLLAFGMFILGERRADDTAGGRILIYSILMFFTHPALFAVFALYVIARSFVEARFMRRFAALVPALGLAVWHAAASAAAPVTAAAPYDPTIAGYSLYKLATLSLIGPYVDFFLPWGGTFFGHGFVHWSLVGLNGVFVVLVLLGIVLQRRLPLGEKQVPVTGLFIFTAGVSLFIPWRIGGAVDVGTMVLAMSVFYLVANARLPAWTGIGASALAVVFVCLSVFFTMASAGWMTTAMAAPDVPERRALYAVDPYAAAPAWRAVAESRLDRPVPPGGFVRMR